MKQEKANLATSSCVALVVVFAMVLSGCASGPQRRSDVDTRGPTPADTPQYNKGNMKPYTIRGRTYHPKIPNRGYDETGLASWYGAESGNRTANGEVFHPDGISAAHKTFPLPSIAEVTYLETGKSIRVRINDRGPFAEGRIIDLSRGAARALGTYGVGTAKVRVTWLGPAAPLSAAPVQVRASDDDLNYIVQIGAFSQKDNAERVRDRMDGARIDKRDGLYIVYLGPFKGAAKAETQRQSAIDAGFTSAVLRRQN